MGLTEDHPAQTCAEDALWQIVFSALESIKTTKVVIKS